VLTQIAFVLIFGFTDCAPRGHGVDVADDGRNRKRPDKAKRVCLGHLTGDNADQIEAFLEARLIDRNVWPGLEPVDMLEFDVRKQLGDLLQRLHVAERGCEDQLVAVGGELTKHAFGIGGLRDVFHERGLDLVAHLLFETEPAHVVLLGPAAVATRAQIDERNLERLGGEGHDRRRAHHQTRCNA